MVCLQKDEIAQKGLSKPRIDGAGTIPSPLPKKCRTPFPGKSKRANPIPWTPSFSITLILSSAFLSQKNFGPLRKRSLSLLVSHPSWMKPPWSLTWCFLTGPSLSAGRMTMWSPDRDFRCSGCGALSWINPLRYPEYRGCHHQHSKGNRW